MTLLDKGWARWYINVLIEAYQVEFNSVLTSLFPGVDKVCLSLAGKPPLQACLTSMSGTAKKRICLGADSMLAFYNTILDAMLDVHR